MVVAMRCHVRLRRELAELGWRPGEIRRLTERYPDSTGGP
jgi:hypothetical protein